MGAMLSLPHGGRLVNREIKDEEERGYLWGKAQELKRVALNREQIEDLENIADGGYSPLKGFLGRHDFLKVVQDMALEDGTVWTVPIVLAVSKEEAEQVQGAREIALVDREGQVLALMELEEAYDYDKEATAKELYGTAGPDHPGVREWLAQGNFLLGGKIRLLQRRSTQFDRYRLRPIETRVLFKAKGWRTVVGFQTRNVPHRGHEYVQKSALEIVDGILVHPKLGKKKEGDFKDEVILKAYQVLIDHYYLRDHAVLAAFAARMRYMGPREAVFDALVRKNYGCTHFIVGRDHAGVGSFYDPKAAQRIFEGLPDLGIVPLRFDNVFYCRKCGGMVSAKTCPHGPEDRIIPSGTYLRELLQKGGIPPAELMRPEVAQVILEEEEPFV